MLGLRVLRLLVNTRVSVIQVSTQCFGVLCMLLMCHVLAHSVLVYCMLLMCHVLAHSVLVCYVCYLCVMC